jgi:type IX secretion system PorP/SprF family membrane protein
MKKINHTFLLLFCTVLVVKIAVAQDQHLTQYYSNEVFINPSLAGSNNGQLRVSANTKQQWNSIGSAYSTSVFAVDQSVMTSSKMTLAGGLIFMSDKMGDSKFKTFNVSGNLSATIKTNSRSKISAGMQIGWAQSSINLNNLSWDSQYDGRRYDPSLSSLETNNAQNFSRISNALGIAYSVNFSKYKKIKFAVSGHNLINNKFSFYGNTSERLYTRFNFYSSGEFGNPNINVSYLPSLIMQVQGPNLTVVGGLLVSYRMGVDSRVTAVNKSNALMWGIHYRLSDAIIPSVHYEYKRKLRFGLSYDINLSELTNASNGRGGFELSFNYFLGGR